MTNLIFEASSLKQFDITEASLIATETMIGLITILLNTLFLIAIQK